MSVNAKRAARLFVRLYPRAWRERYGGEFNALLDETPAAWREAANIAGSAARARLSPRLPAAFLASAAVFAPWQICAAAAVPLALLVLNYLLGIPAIREGDTLYIATRQLSVQAFCGSGSLANIVIGGGFLGIATAAGRRVRFAYLAAALPVALVAAQTGRIVWSAMAAGIN